MAEDQHFSPTTGSRRSASGDPESGLDSTGAMLTAKELQQLLKISVKTIYSYVRRGLIPYVRIQSNLRFPKQRILEWIEQQSYDPRPTQRKLTKKR